MCVAYGGSYLAMAGVCLQVTVYSEENEMNFAIPTASVKARAVDMIHFNVT